MPRAARLLRRFGGVGQRVAAAPGGPVRRLARREPTMLAAFVVVVIAAGLLLATGAGRSHRPAAARPLTAQPSATGPSTPPAPRSQLGPSVGAQVSAYLVEVSRRQALLRTLPATSSVTAVVDLTGYLTPRVVATLVTATPGLALDGAFAGAAPPARGDVHALTLSPTVGLVAALRAVRTSARTVAGTYGRLRAAARRDPTPRARRVVHAYRDLGRQAVVDLAGVGPGLGCVFAVVVSGSPAALLRLAADPDVRVVDPDSAEVPAGELRIVPLRPQETSVVAPLAFAGG